MGWSDINLKDVKPEQRDELPLGAFTFELMPGAKFDDYGGVSVSASIVDEGEARGRRAFFSYPDPSSVAQNGKVKKWSAGALKQLEQALGVDALDGESPTDYLNRAAGTRFGAEVKVSKRLREDGTPRHELSIFTTRPAV